MLPFKNDSIAHDDFIIKIKALIAADDMPDIWSSRGYDSVGGCRTDLYLK